MNFKEEIKQGGWALFLDRDGVINQRIEGGYVLNYESFKFLPRILESLHLLAQNFKYIFIVTNQQAIGKGLVKEADIDVIHSKMLDEINDAGGRIDHIFVAPQLIDDRSNYRKPGTGMAIEATKIYPGVALTRSVMAGDSESDMQFARNTGMTGVFIGDPSSIKSGMYEYSFSSLYEFALYISG
jgi:histidinol-phosphate phosphatase family protein